MSTPPVLEELYSAFLALLGIDASSLQQPAPAEPEQAAPAVQPAAPVEGQPVAATPEAAPQPPPPPPSPCRIVDPKETGYHLDVTVAPAQVVAAAELVTRFGFSIDTITGVDWMAQGEMEVVYDYFHFSSPLHVVVRARVPRENPELPTVSEVFPGANWHERETHEFLGIRFLGHPNLVPLLLPEDATYHPLRKDFTGAA
jgi:NADH-quinone oxidoreductase subunit C